MTKSIAVIGAGVIGLTTAIELMEHGYNVIMYAEHFSPHTTSDRAGAIWAPFKIKPLALAMQWSIHSLNKFREIAEIHPHAGVIIKMHTEMFDIPTRKPNWLQHLKSLPLPSYIPQNFKEYSYCVELPFIDTNVYMPYLMANFQKLGGAIVQTKIDCLNDLFKKHDLIINCSGLGARILCRDNLVYPLRGQVLSIEKVANFNDSLVYSKPTELTHLFSRTHDCLIGGTVEDQQWRLDPDKTITQAILSRIKKIHPSIGEIRIITEKVGLRPARSSVRLEVEKINKMKTIIHNYGHGGSGYTVSWGCAATVLDLTNQILRK